MKVYTAVVEQCADTGLHVGYVPGFPGAHTQAEFYLLDTNGIYQLVQTTDGVFTSEVTEGFSLRVEWLWREPLPPVLSVLREWKII